MGDIVLIPFPFSELTKIKVRPAVIIAETKDKYRDLVVSAVSSVVPKKPAEREFVVKPAKYNKLRVVSVFKVDRIVTVRREDIVADLGRLTSNEIEIFKEKLIRMIGSQ